MHLQRTVSRSKVIRLTSVSEGLLLLVALLWISASGHQVTLIPTFMTPLWALLICGPLIAFNFWLWKVRDNYPPLAEFLHEHIIPLCANLDVRAIATVALLSGAAEELFFRGALLLELSRWFGLSGAALCSGILFGYAHFIGSAHKAPAMVALYMAFGVYLGLGYAISQDLAALMMAHALYNFCSMIFVRYRIVPHEGRR